jgi:hypothetical protein
MANFAREPRSGEVLRQSLLGRRLARPQSIRINSKGRAQNLALTIRNYAVFCPPGEYRGFLAARRLLCILSDLCDLAP